MHVPTPERLLKRIRLLVAIFVVGLVLAGVTAFPLLREVNALAGFISSDSPATEGSLRSWILFVRAGLESTYRDYPFIGYGTDWLAFGHLAIAVFFYGAWRDPVRNVWVLHAGLIVCAAVIPVALICGEIREIPLYWRLIDCAFGVFGAIPLWYALILTRQLEHAQSKG